MVYKSLVMNTAKTCDDWRAVLREQGRTIAWLADRTETPRWTVYAYSRGNRRPSNTWLLKVAEALGVEPATIGAEAAA